MIRNGLLKINMGMLQLIQTSMEVALAVLVAKAEAVASVASKIFLINSLVGRAVDLVAIRMHPNKVKTYSMSWI